MPTFADLAGAKLPTSQPVDGVSIVPLMKGQTIPERSIFWHFPLYLKGNGEAKVIPVAGTDDLYWRATPSSMIMKGDWKMINFFEDNSFHLYNLAKDLSESSDLSSEYPAVAKQLKAELRQWQKDTKAVIPTVINDGFDPETQDEKKKGQK